MRYDKLVRDNIPGIIIKNGKKPTTHIAEEREYAKKLEEKLQEEMKEYLFARNEEEFADILEVLDAIAVFRGFDSTKIAELKRQKLQKNGGFTKRIILEEVLG